MAGLCEGDNEPPGSLKAICKSMLRIVLTLFMPLPMAADPLCDAFTSRLRAATCRPAGANRYPPDPLGGEEGGRAISLSSTKFGLIYDNGDNYNDDDDYDDDNDEDNVID
ncbi:hypothetical protein ANN_00273 [Periplaneta americana]|uniref:Uncharacterized protein n=1 Tax=Periplaneta americana TaxID=6978 RepID=A0ABQ8TS51_PERAM|nr:hypothetical protein ANN_00273 [Periplaneta americana]